MTIPSSGPVTFTDIQTEFGGSNPIGLNEYYAGGGLVPAGTTGTYGAVPSSGQISVQNFYGTTAYTPVYIEELFSSWIYKGTGTTQTITNGIDLSGKGGLVWIKNRTLGTTNHTLVDTVRGANQRIFTNLTNAQSSGTGGAASFLSNGFTSTDSASGNDFASWTFREQPKFFDIVTYTGDGTAGRTVAHNLGAVPGCIMVKRITGGTGDWAIYHRSLGNTRSLQFSTLEAVTNLNWQNTSPTSTNFTVGSSADLNASGSTYVAYLYAHNAGGFGPTGSDNIITCGSFTAVNINGNASGLVTDLGYEPQLVLYKKYSAGAENWFLVDNIRGFCQRENNSLFPNTTAVETNTSGGNSQFPSPTGFQLNLSGAVGSTYIYIAIRRGPMKVPTVGTSVFSPLVTTASDTAIITTGFPVDLQIGGYRASTNATNNWNMFTRRIQLSTITDNSGAGLLTSSTAAENTGLTFPYNYNNTGYQNYGSRTWSLNFVRAPQFFEVVCYTGTGSVRTVDHNLGVVPEMVIYRRRDITSNWIIYCLYNTAASSDPANNYLNFDTNLSGFANTYYDLPTSSVLNLRTVATNTSGGTYVAYLFATCAGVSKVGSYTGTGTTQQINCGFTSGARFVLIKRTDASLSAWYLWDSARGIVAGNDPYLLLNSTVAEVTNTDYVDTYSAGFEISSTAPAAINASGGKYIFLAIA
jgi:hypothetical protein